MLLDNDEADERLESPNNVVRSFKGLKTFDPIRTQFGKDVSKESQESQTRIEPFRNGAGPRLGKERATSEVRDTAVSLHKLGYKHEEIADKLGINYQQSANYAHNQKVGKRKMKLDPSEAMDEVRQAALDKLMCAMGLISEDKLSKLSAPNLAHIASSMSQIVERTMPKEEKRDSAVTLVVYAPQVKEENSFKVVEI
jgi:hypothetical protein